MTFLRLFIWIVIGFIIAKIIGAVIQVFRNLLAPPKVPQKPIEPGKKQEDYKNIEDADFEDITTHDQ